MKSLFKYLEKSLIIIALSLIFLSLVVIGILVINSVLDITESITHYYQVRERHKKNCLADTLDPSSTHVMVWRDETIMGFGSEDSYGCFMIKKGTEK